MIGCACGAIAAILFMSRLIAMRTRAIIRKWATENGIEILSATVKRFPFKGPFNRGTNFRGQMVLWLKVRLKDGLEKSCWLRCGNRFGGIWLGNETEAKWEDNAMTVEQQPE